MNDTWGHQAGDEVIRRVALALRNSLRPADALSRFGGEEFMILIRDATGEQSAEVAGRLCTNIAALGDLPGNVRMTVSIGVAESNTADTPEELIRRCDEAIVPFKKRRTEYRHAGQVCFRPRRSDSRPSLCLIA